MKPQMFQMSNSCWNKMLRWKKTLVALHAVCFINSSRSWILYLFGSPCCSKLHCLTIMKYIFRYVLNDKLTKLVQSDKTDIYWRVNVTAMLNPYVCTWRGKYVTSFAGSQGGAADNHNVKCKWGSLMIQVVSMERALTTFIDLSMLFVQAGFFVMLSEPFHSYSCRH